MLPTGAAGCSLRQVVRHSWPIGSIQVVGGLGARGTKHLNNHLDPERGGRSRAVLETGSALPSGLLPSLILSWAFAGLYGPDCSLALAGRMKCCREATGLGNQDARDCLAVGLEF